ncbi:heterokaryon incompatibility protein-domain-containing protein, partial [Massariosphaeria phaeospora]
MENYLLYWENAEEPEDDGSPFFKHQPLDHEKPSFRLIKFLPDVSQLNGPVRCEIYHDTVDSDYTCLSYVWGPPLPDDKMAQIYINNKPFLIRPNLWEFLKVARRKFAHRPIWIDALCIDQSNTKERNHQVRQMGTIYSQAKGVIAWLGNTASIAAFVAYMHYIEEGNETSSNEPRRSRPYFWEDTHKMKARQDFVTNQYWKRGWIIQEMLLAKDVTVLVREEEMGLASLIRTIVRTRWSLSLINSPWYKLQELGKVLKIDDPKSTQKGSLIDLLATFGGQECAIRKDRIYSLLSLCKEGPNIDVDYD